MYIIRFKIFGINKIFTTYMKHIIIGTTAINRSELHKTIVPPWYEYINVLNRTKYNIQWFVNIDYIEKIGEDIEVTKECFKNIIPEIPITFMEKQTIDGNIFQANKRIALYIENYVNENKLNIDDVIILWLEDDWKLESIILPLEELIENIFKISRY